MKKITISLCLITTIVVIACNKQEQSVNKTPGQEVYLDLADTAEGSYFSSLNVYSKQLDKKATLGRVLFYDGHLSLNNAVSCGSCHKQQFAFADNAALSMGFEGRMAGRNTPALQDFLEGRKLTLKSDGEVNFPRQSLFWDGRENDLVNLVLRPVGNHVEMGINDMDALPAKLNNLPYYAGLVKDAYGTDQLTLDIISESIATFMLAITVDSTRFRRTKFNERTAQEQLGERLFNTKYNCASCHIPSGQYFGNPPSSDIGLDVVAKDKGMGAMNKAMDGMFRVPKLHNVALTAPYMHDGRFNTLDEVLEHYSTGIQPSSNLAPELTEGYNNGEPIPMRMNISTDEKAAIIAFLNTLTDYSMLTNPKYSNPFKTK